MDTEYIINKCFKSEDMRTHLLSQADKLSATQICEIVDGAPIELVEKFNIYETLTSKYPNDSVYLEYMVDCKLAVDNCIADDDEIFVYEEIYEHNGVKSVVCAVKRENLLYSTKHEQRHECKLGYRRISKWRLVSSNASSDTFEKMYYYYLYDGSISIYTSTGMDYRRHALIPTPFKTGDILMIDCLPFMSPTRAIVTSVSDYGALTVGVQEENGQYTVNPLNEVTRCSPLSPLYKIRKISDYNPNIMTDKELELFGAPAVVFREGAAIGWRYK